MADKGRLMGYTETMFTSFESVRRHLDSLGLFHMDLTLGRIVRALERLGLQHPPFRAAQIVGTNGKGSTATFLASLAQAHGRKVGLYTSPHFVSPDERIRINGMPLPPPRWPDLANDVYRAEPRLTYFEFLTVLAVLSFAEAEVDVAVLEAGLGGRWDATTAVRADLVCFTPMAMDHEAILGKTLDAIAADKACAMRPGVPALTGPQSPEVLERLRRTAGERGTPLSSVRLTLPRAVRLGLTGPHQQDNARLALAAWELLGHGDVNHEAVRRGLQTAFLPGRFQRILPRDGLPEILLDGAHNPQGMAALHAAVEAAGIRPGAVVFSCLADKNLEDMLPSLHALAGSAPLLVPTIADNSRAAPGAALAARVGGRAVARLTDALEAATSLASGRPVVLCGSLYLLAEFFALYPHYLTLSPATEAA